MTGDPAPPSLLHWLAEGWGRDPDRLALVERDRKVTYGALGGGVGRAGRVLQEACGAHPGPVALVAGNSIEYVLAALGGLAAGRVVAEINPRESRERLRDVLARLGPAVVLSDLAPGLVADTAPRVLDVEQFAVELLTARPLREFAPARAASEPAFVVFTSGTTGAPKGVMLGEDGLRAVTSAILERLPIRADERYALVLPLNHTYGKSVLLTTLRAGGTLLLESGFDDLPAFCARLSAQRVTAFAAVPYHAHLLRGRAPLQDFDLSHLRTLTISGGPMPPAALAELAQRLPATDIYFMYGLTECSTRAAILPPSARAERTGSCGLPLSCMSVRIEREDGSVAGPGDSGEVLLAGPNVMLGYWGDAAATAAALRGGWLHTGDLGRVDADGFLYLEGRRNDLIKCAGERISAVEIEETLAAHPRVAEVAVAAVPHAMLGEAVGAWIVGREPGPSRDELVSHCAARLAAYKIPRAWHFVRELPRTASGKVQKHRLPDISPAREGRAP